MTRRGIADRLPPLPARPTSETGFLYWLTPTATEIYPSSDRREKRAAYRRSIGRKDVPGSLAAQVVTKEFWPTPSANPPGWKNIEVVDKNGNPPEHPNQRFYDKQTGRLVQKGLEQVVKMWPTPRASEYKDCGPLGSKSYRHMLDRHYLCAKAQEADNITGKLNPTWVEWLMGFPQGWTELNESMH